MKNEPFAFFAQIKPIQKSSDTFEKFKKEQLYYYYFQKDSLYYIFLYGEKKTESHLQVLEIIKELNTRKRKIRSLRGYILYVFSYLKNESTMLSTNLQPRFWEKVNDVIKQNKKDGLLKFLFNVSDNNITLNTENFKINHQIQNLQSEILLLKKQIEILNSTVISVETKDVKPVLDSEQVDQSNNDFKKQEFYSVSQIDSSILPDIINEGFLFNRRNLGSIKEYYEGTSKFSLFKTRGFSLKYDTIRKHSLYNSIREHSAKLILK